MSLDRVNLIQPFEVIVHFDSKWVGEVGTEERKQVYSQDSVTRVSLPLTSREWCSIAMREGEEYVGGCCGTMGQLQDIISYVFRDSGFIEASDFLTVASLAQGHEGFEGFAEMTEDQFLAALQGWEGLSPWDKIGLVYNAVEAKLAPASRDLPRIEEDPIELLSSCLSQASWSSLFSNDKESEADKTHAANRLVWLAKALKPTKQLLEQLEKADESFSGYALVSDQQVLSNRFGFCLYSTLEEAQRIREITSRNEQAPDCAVHEVTVDTTRGVEIGPIAA